jgi:hypothetical protein
MTFEQAKQQIAGNTFLKTKTWDSVIENISGADLKYCIDQAAELWQSENLAEIEAKDKRIAELEAVLVNIYFTAKGLLK